MRFGEMARFEIEHQLRRPATIIFTLALAALTLLLNFGLAEGPRSVNSPLTVASAGALMGLAGMLITAALFTDAATRDVASGMHPLLYTEPITKIEYLGGRFVGALLVNAVIVLAIPLGQLLALKVPPIEGPETYLPFQLGTYVQPFLLLTLPNVLVTAVIVFTVSALARRALPAYLVAVAMGIAYLFSVELQSHVGTRTLAVMMDPFGVTAVMHHIRSWTPSERNVWQIGVPRLMLLNRALWLSIAVCIFALLHWRFQLALPAAGRWRWLKRTPAETELTDTASHVTVPAASREFGPRSTLRQTWAIARLALTDVVFSRVFLWIAAAAIAIVFLFGWEVGATVFETQTWPVTHLVAGTVLSVPMSIVFAVLIAIYAGELVWRDRDLRMDMVGGTVPVAEGTTLAGSFLALIGMIVGLQVVLMAAGMLLQAVQGYYTFEPFLYLKILFGFKLADYLLFAVLAMAVHVIVDNKAVGHLVVVLVYLSTVFGPGWGIGHHLLLYGTDPGWVYSDMNGFGPFVRPFVWFKLYWAAWALLLAVAGTLFWVRGTERGLRRRALLARARLGGRVAAVAGVAIVLVATLGGFVFYNTNVLNENASREDVEERRAEYERVYKRYEGMPQPRLVANELRVEIDPGRRAVAIDGTYRLVNLSGVPIDSVHVVLPQEVETRAIRLDRAAVRVLDDRRRHYQIHALAEPLRPGDTLGIAYAVAFVPRGFRNGGINTSVAGNGAYFDRRWLPYIGYQPALELARIKGRKAQALPEHRIPALEDTAARRVRFDVRNEDLVHVDAVIGTAGDQIAITPGTLVREWRKDGRRYFQYRTDTPLPHGAPILSGRYSVRQDSWRGVSLKVFHHPGHAVNVDRIVRGMKASLDYYTTNFGPYQFREMRVVEFPRYASFARAHPFTIAYSEGGAFLTRVDEGEVDRPFFVTAHEAAHQWWGNEVTPARVRGGALISESLAQYSSMMVLEKTYGREHARRFYDYNLQYYLDGRAASQNAEVPLLQVEGQNWLYYFKGAVALYTMREHIGEDAVNTALRRYLDRHRASGPPYPTSLDLYAELQAVTPDSLKSLLSDLFEHATMTEVSADSATWQPARDGTMRVTLHVTATKVRVDSTGTERPAPMNDLIEIGVFAGAREGASRGDTLYLRRHRITSGAQAITVTVPREPAEAGIDPDGKVIQRRPNDNVVEVERRRPVAAGP